MFNLPEAQLYLTQSTEMNSSEKFCLKWNDYQGNVVNSFHDLREDLDFSDVTLVCEDNKQIEAHKVIISACSPFFSSILKRNKHPHPLIYMRGMKSKELIAIVDFIYNGEANIFQEDIDEFLKIAEELQLKGLVGFDDDKDVTNMTNISEPKPKVNCFPKQELKIHNEERNLYIVENISESSENYWENQPIVQIDTTKKVVIDPQTEELQTKIASMMENINEGENKWRCTVCGKAAQKKQSITRHVESHIEGVSHPCNQCGKVSRSAASLQVHMSTTHRNK